MATNPAPKQTSSNRPTDRKVIASNRKARHDYKIFDTIEAGIVLTGTEVKSLRAGRATLVDGYATVSDDEVWLRGVHIAEYAEGTWTNHAPRRARKLLLHRMEISRLTSKLRESSNGLALVPLSIYFSDGKVKVELGLGRGKKEYDKRQSMAERDADREIARFAGRRAKGMSD